MWLCTNSEIRYYWNQANLVNSNNVFFLARSTRCRTIQTCMIYTMNSCIILSGYKSAAHVFPRHEDTAKHMDRWSSRSFPHQRSQLCQERSLAGSRKSSTLIPESKTEQEPWLGKAVWPLTLNNTWAQSAVRYSDSITVMSPFPRQAGRLGIGFPTPKLTSHTARSAVFSALQTGHPVGLNVKVSVITKPLAVGLGVKGGHLQVWTEDITTYAQT